MRRRRSRFCGATLSRGTALRTEYADRFDDYLGWMRPRLDESRRILAPQGSLYFHIDPRELDSQGASRRDLRTRVLPQRGDLGVRLRRANHAPMAGEARCDPRLREGSEGISLRRLRGHARAVHGAPAADARASRARQAADRRVGAHHRPQPRRASEPVTRRRSRLGSCAGSSPRHRVAGI